MSIVARMLTVQTTGASAGVLLILLAAVSADRFTAYLADAASGRFGGTTVFLLLGLRIPEFVALLAPLGLYAGLALAFARIIADGELVAIRSAGLSTRWLVMWAALVSLPVAALIALCAVWLAPAAERNLMPLLSAGGVNEFAFVRAGHFSANRRQGPTLWAREVSPDRSLLLDVFMAEQDSPHVGIPGVMRVTVADTASQLIDPLTASRFLVLQRGNRLEGEPGMLGFRSTQFERLGQRIGVTVVDVHDRSTSSLSMTTLFSARGSAEAAELQWRLTLIAGAPLAAWLLLGVLPTAGRRGWSLQLLGGLGAYLVFFLLASAAREAISDGRIPAWPGLPALTVIAMAMALGLIAARERVGRRRPNGATGQ